MIIIVIIVTLVTIAILIPLRLTVILTCIVTEVAFGRGDLSGCLLGAFTGGQRTAYFL